MDCRRGDWPAALGHLDLALRRDADDLRARDLKAMVLRHLGRGDEADRLLEETRALDPLDAWARRLAGDPAPIDAQTRLDLAHDLARAGLIDDAIAVLEEARIAAGDLPGRDLGAAPLVAYTLGWLEERRGKRDAAIAHFRRAALLPPDHCFPARLEEIAVLEAAIRADPGDPRAPYYLGNLLYDRRRHREAIALWERSVRLDPGFAAAWRNLGIGRFNVLRRPAAAREAFEKALRADPGNARILHERDQLWKRTGVPPARRIRELESRSDLVGRRDDLSVEYCALLNRLGRHDDARRLLEGRRFQPWEGGEGLVLGQHVRTLLALGRRALAAGDAAAALGHFEAALDCPPRLGEARHLLAGASDIRYWLGRAREALGDRKGAREEWARAAASEGDFREMGVRPFSEMTCFSALALERLGKKARARKLLRDLLAHARKLRETEAKIDYFATSLPAMLLFDDDIAARRRTESLFLEALARRGLGQDAKARKLAGEVLRRDPGHGGAADLREEMGPI